MSRARYDNEIIGLEMIQAVVDEFYERIQSHPTLAEPFAIIHDWPEHKDRLAHFWWLSLGGEPYRDYQYNVGPLHMALDINDAHVDDWLELFYEVMSKYIAEEQVDAWHGRAQNMGRSIRMLVEYGQQMRAQQAAQQ